MLTGDPTEEFEVSGSRDLARIESNRVRGGAVLVLNDGVVGKAAKLSKIVSGVKISGWEWLDELATKTRATTTINGNNFMLFSPKHWFIRFPRRLSIQTLHSSHHQILNLQLRTHHQSHHLLIHLQFRRPYQEKFLGCLH